MMKSAANGSRVSVRWVPSIFSVTMRSPRWPVAAEFSRPLAEFALAGAWPLATDRAACHPRPGVEPDLYADKYRWTSPRLADARVSPSGCGSVLATSRDELA